jgi:hypothetical protein
LNNLPPPGVKGFEFSHKSAYMSGFQRHARHWRRIFDEFIAAPLEAAGFIPKLKATPRTPYFIGANRNVR